MEVWARKQFSGWGRTARAESPTARPEKRSQVREALADLRGESVIPFGAGRSYGDAALNSAGHAILTRRLDRLLEFDPKTGLLVAESGVSFGELVRLFVPRGFIPPVVPGTGFATLGGGIANDVHGKNHHRVGSIGQHLQWFDLCTPTGEMVRVDASEDTPLLRATLGGIGLTGVIERACIRLARVPSNSVVVRKRRMTNLDQFLASFAEEEEERSEYVVGWIDALATGGSLGRGILETASPSAHQMEDRLRTSRRIPIDFPALVLNPWSVRLFNSLYFHRIPKDGSEEQMPYRKFLFPLDAIEDWNRIYGRRGFRQFQCVVPRPSGRAAMTALLQRIADAGTGSFLAVIKATGEAGRGYLSFAQPGYTLALDFPNSTVSRRLIESLEDIVIEHGGRTYLAKDSTLTAVRFRAMYPFADMYSQVLSSIDPERRMRSDMSQRLGLTAVRNG